ncbi:hypothetical protein DN523_16525 [Burkholderia multivorans]|nr:hypothetical protein C6Q02_27260 [Burkholderia multivorans]RAA23987.1 hypothetical protein DN470_19040 [Burkholderia multivorans]RAA31568.1 hypothetical protein DN471_04870 [Burkholderia multivorans]RAA37038.1 hypothetical protein DN465_06995 [Burkholderia multivorans]RAA41411.1 hypothetical protein DN500_19845 [Burkholderia multivorans]
MLMPRSLVFFIVFLIVFFGLRHTSNPHRKLEATCAAHEPPGSAPTRDAQDFACEPAAEIEYRDGDTSHISDTYQYLWDN